MGQMFANIIIDISHEKVDKTFQYRIPDRLFPLIRAGMQVMIPFGMGNGLRKGYVVEITDRPEYDVEKMKEVAEVLAGSVTAESQLIELAWWMKEQYGSTMNQALKTVLPVKQKVRSQENKSLICLISNEERKEAVKEAEKKHFAARVRVLELFLKEDELPYETVINKAAVSASSLKPLIDKGILQLRRENIFRNPIGKGKWTQAAVTLNEEQTAIVESFSEDYRQGKRDVYLIHGITGSGKTEVYLELIDQVRQEGKQVIVLIPEIALTYQTVMRFQNRFKDRVSIINSRLSAGERYDQLERAKKGEVDIMIGPRSALFTPFKKLGLIVIDEEHEGAYKSEAVPRYHAREVAQWLAKKNGASLVLGSATPSVEAYTKALAGEFCLFTLNNRAKSQSRLAQVEVVDLRRELAEGNKSIFSRVLQVKMEERLAKGEQIMLFINRRGFANFVSCRSCGEAIKCPHCDVTLTLHYDSRLVCHYCGYSLPMPAVCPSCGSSYIANFGTGTQKIEVFVRKMFPKSRALRMDMDTTSKKGGHEEILAAFSRGEADILIGTQMIVKGHDFPKVTLVGVLAADLSLYAPDYRSGERTFELLTQAAGRAGRDSLAGDVIIQTYNPEHYSIVTAANQDYEGFYHQEMAYRRLMKYPPAVHLMTLQFSSKEEEALILAVESLARQIEPRTLSLSAQQIGPADASIYKVNDIYRKILYIKHENYDILIKIRRDCDEFAKRQTELFRLILIQYDFS